MADEKARVDSIESAKFSNVEVDHPTIREYGKNMAKMGLSKDEAAKRLGMPREVVDKIYREAEAERK